MPGALNYVTGSIGGFLIVLLAVLYLAEKYFVQSWRVRWPVPIAPLIAAAWIGRDESLCELRDPPGYASDRFASYREAVCARTNDSPYLFTPGLHLTALQGGVTVTHPPGGAICMHPAGDTKFPFYQRRGYEDEREFSTRAGTSA